MTQNSQNASALLTWVILGRSRTCYAVMSQLRFGNNGFSSMKTTNSRGSSPMKLMLISLVDSPSQVSSSSSLCARGSLTKRKKESFDDDEEEDGSNWKYGYSEICAEESSDGTCYYNLDYFIGV